MKVIPVSISVLFLAAISISGCKKTNDDPVRFPKGTFPDSVLNMSALNSQFDDYNLDIHEINENIPIIFSSNRKSSGGQFDLEQAMISFTFDKINGNFEMEAKLISDAFFVKLINQAQTPRNDFGPYRLYSPSDGYEYFLLSSANLNGDLDLFYLKNRPYFSASLPDIDGPHPVTLLNTASNDAYICFNQNLDTLYFTSDRNGNFDIFMQTRSGNIDLYGWLGQSLQNPVPLDSLNSESNDKCPIFFGNVMIFTSDRPGGLGGFDLYYALFKNGKWTSPVNFGPEINSSADEYRPVIGFHPEFENKFLMFSSNRTGGKGGYDIYFKGIDLPEN